MSDDKDPMVYSSGVLNGGGDIPSAGRPSYPGEASDAAFDVATERAEARRVAQAQAEARRDAMKTKPYPPGGQGTNRLKLDDAGTGGDGVALRDARDRRLMTGDRACQARIVYLNERGQRVSFEEVPSRTVVRMTMVDGDGRIASSNLDATAFKSIKDILSGYGSDRLEAPKAEKEDDDERMANAIEELRLLSETHAGAAQIMAWINEGASRRVQPPAPTPNGRRRFELDDPPTIDAVKAIGREVLRGALEREERKILGDGYAESGPPNGGGGVNMFEAARAQALGYAEGTPPAQPAEGGGGTLVADDPVDTGMF